MHRSRFLLFVLSIFLFGSIGVPCEAQNDLKSPGTEAQVAVDRANSELDEVYRNLLAKAADAQEESSLREAQRTWIKWRDAEANYLARHGGAIGGSAMREAFAAAELELIKAGIAALKEYAAPLPSD